MILWENTQKYAVTNIRSILRIGNPLYTGSVSVAVLPSDKSSREHSIMRILGQNKIKIHKKKLSPILGKIRIGGVGKMQFNFRFSKSLLRKKLPN